MKTNLFFRFATIAFVALAIVGCDQKENGNGNGGKEDIIAVTDAVSTVYTPAGLSGYENVFGNFSNPELEALENFETIREADIPKRFPNDPFKPVPNEYHYWQIESNDGIYGGVIYNGKITIPPTKYKVLMPAPNQPLYAIVGGSPPEGGTWKTGKRAGKTKILVGLASVVTGREVIPCRFKDITTRIDPDLGPFVSCVMEDEDGKETDYHYWMNGIPIAEDWPRLKNFNFPVIKDIKIFERNGKMGIKEGHIIKTPAIYDLLLEVPGRPYHFVAYKNAEIVGKIEEGKAVDNDRNYVGTVKDGFVLDKNSTVVGRVIQSKDETLFVGLNAKCGIIYYRGYVTIPLVYDTHEFMSMGNGSFIVDNIRFKGKGINVARIDVVRSVDGGYPANYFDLNNLDPI